MQAYKSYRQISSTRRTGAVTKPYALPGTRLLRDDLLFRQDFVRACDTWKYDARCPFYSIKRLWLISQSHRKGLINVSDVMKLCSLLECTDDGGAQIQAN